MEKPTKKYETLIRTAYQQFALHGYEKTTIDDILKASNISKGLFYHHFANKNELFCCFIYTGSKGDYGKNSWKFLKQKI